MKGKTPSPPPTKKNTICLIMFFDFSQNVLKNTLSMVFESRQVSRKDFQLMVVLICLDVEDVMCK